MSVTYSAFMLGQIAAGFTWAGKQMGMALLFSQPNVTSPGDFTGNANAHTAYDLTGLLNTLGWTEVSVDANNGSPTYVRTTSNLSSTSASGVTTVSYATDFAPIPTGPTAKPVYVSAAVFYIVGTVAGVVNPWMLVTDDAFDAVVYPGLIVTGATVSGAVQRNFFSYSVSGSVVTMTPAPIVRTPGQLVWQAARETHVYLIPQRVNYIPDPSFEEVGLFGWRSDGTMTRTVGGADNPANHYVHTTGYVLESIPIPPASVARFSAYVRSSVVGATVNLGLKTLDTAYETLAVHYAWAAPQPLGATWTRYDGLFTVAADNMSAMVPRIEANQPFDCDLVVLEASSALHDYWDGDAQTAFVGDFSWQGGAAGVARSYSFWYNNRYQTAARLFGQYITGQISVRPALIYDWVPEGATIMTHWDVLSDTDTKHPLEDWVNKQYNRVTGYDITGITFQPSGTPTSAVFNATAGSATIQGTVVNGPATQYFLTLSAIAVGQFASVGVLASNHILGGMGISNTYDAAYAVFAASLANYAQAYIIQRVGNANVPSDFIIYNVRQI